MTENMALIVDDSRVARITLKKLLVAQGFAISENSSGEEALTFLNEAEQLPAVIFMDVMMDGMDGLETTRQIKQDQRYAQIPVVMCTGHDSETEIENAMTTGAVAVLSKPPQEAQLLTVLEAVKQAQVVKNLTEQVEASDVIAAPIDEQAIIDKVSLVVNEQLNATVQQAVNDAVAEIHAAEVQQAELDYAQIAEQVAVQLSDVTETKAQQAAQETSRQTASEVVTEQLEQALQTQLDGMLPDLQAQLAEQLVAGVNETVAETVKAQAEQVVTQ
jgi:CheY-like chemotaxis protein